MDASRSANTSPTGVERYSTEILHALLNVLKNEKDWKPLLYTPKLLPNFPLKIQKRLWCPRFWTLFRLSLEMLHHKPDALFVPAHVLPFFAPRKSFVTVHDIAYEKYPLAYGTFQSFYLEWSTRRALKKCEKVIVPTEAVKADLIKYYQADSKRIAVIPHGLVTPMKVDKETIQTTWHHYQLDRNEPVFFFIGRLETKKNLLILLDAWKIVRKKCSRGRLFLGGMYGHGFNELFRRMEDDDLKGTVLAPGYISEEEASAFFQEATALVYPSREEGFGLPILQAFQSGTAVICSDIPALKEVGGGAALYANPNSPQAFADHMLHLIQNPALSQKLSKLGKSRLSLFSWGRAARSICHLLT